MEDPRTKYFIRNYALFRLREHNAASGGGYVGVRYTCFVHQLPTEAETKPKLAYEVVLWEGNE